MASLQLGENGCFAVLVYNKRNLTDEQLMKEFSKYGKVTEMQKSGYNAVFIHYKEFAEAKECINELGDNPDFLAKPARPREGRSAVPHHDRLGRSKSVNRDYGDRSAQRDSRCKSMNRLDSYQRQLRQQRKQQEVESSSSSSESGEKRKSCLKKKDSNTPKSEKSEAEGGGEKSDQEAPKKSESPKKSEEEGSPSASPKDVVRFSLPPTRTGSSPRYEPQEGGYDTPQHFNYGRRGGGGVKVGRRGYYLDGCKRGGRGGYYPQQHQQRRPPFQHHQYHPQPQYHYQNQYQNPYHYQGPQHIYNVSRLNHFRQGGHPSQMASSPVGPLLVQAADMEVAEQIQMQGTRDMHDVLVMNFPMWFMLGDVYNMCSNYVKVLHITMNYSHNPAQLPYAIVFVGSKRQAQHLVESLDTLILKSKKIICCLVSELYGSEDEGLQLNPLL